MKATLLVTCFMALLTGAHAQRGGGDGPRFGWSGSAGGNGIAPVFGLSAGVSSASVSVSGGSLPPGGEPRTGPSVNAFMSIAVNPWFSVRPEFGYAAMGSRKSAIGYSYDADYFLTPLLASFELNKKRSLHALVGPQLGCLITASQSSSGIKTDIRDQVLLRDFSVVGGLEWVPDHFGFSIRGQYGFSDASQGPSTVHNRMISACAVWRFK